MTLEPIPYAVLLPLAPWESAPVLAAALASLRDQTWPARMVVVSTDGRLPGALQQVLAASGLPLQLVVGPGGEGVGPVLARGLLACQEAIVVRADADDISLPDRCAIQVAALDAQPQLAAMSGPIAEFVQDVEFCQGIRTVPLSSQAIRRARVWRNPLNHPAAVLRRDTVLQVGNYRHRPGFEDYDLWLRLLRSRSDQVLANVPEVLVWARVGANHLARRRGWSYAVAELRFYCSSAQEGLLPWPAVLAVLAVRLPLRLAPARWLQGAMQLIRQKPSAR